MRMLPLQKFRYLNSWSPFGGKVFFRSKRYGLTKVNTSLGGRLSAFKV